MERKTNKLLGFPWTLSFQTSQNYFRNYCYGASWWDSIIYPTDKREKASWVLKYSPKWLDFSQLSFLPSEKRHFSENTPNPHAQGCSTNGLSGRWSRETFRAFPSGLFTLPFGHFFSKASLHASNLEKRKMKSIPVFVDSPSGLFGGGCCV